MVWCSRYDNIININGIITDQLLVRKFPENLSKMQATNPLSASGYPGKDGEEVSRMFTAQEIAQVETSFIAYYNLFLLY